MDWTGGQIKNDDCSDDVKNVDLSQVHVRSASLMFSPDVRSLTLVDVRLLSVPFRPNRSGGSEGRRSPEG